MDGNSLGQGVSMPDWSAKKPFMTTMSENFILNGAGSQKETRHIVFNLGDSGLDYKAGDALGVIPSCPSELVEDLLSVTNFTGDEEVETNLGLCSLREALTNRYEIHRLSKKWVEGLGQRISTENGPIEIQIVRRRRTSSIDGSLLIDWESNDSQADFPDGYEEIGGLVNHASELWTRLTTDPESMEDYIWSRDYVDAISSDFGEVGFTPQQLIEGMDRLKPRLYSIASSPDFERGTVHLTVAIVRYNHFDRDRTGLCTGFMADRCSTESTEIGVFMSPTRSFVLPIDGSRDVIMVGPGTGIAPFRAFLQQRKADEATGKNWLFFGDWTEEGEFLYREEVQGYVDDGTIDRLDLAWSRDGPEKVYVQHLMSEHGADMWEWLDNGGYFYICGDKNRMAKDVHNTLISISMEHGGLSENDAKEFIEKTLMKDEKRYLRDVY